MPTVIWVGAFVIVINTRDHWPPHVHCKGPGVSVIIDIKTLESRDNRGVKERYLKLLKKVVANNRVILLERWEEIHGEEN